MGAVRLFSGGGGNLLRLLGTGSAGLAAAGLLGLAPAAGSVTPAWSVVPSPNAMAPQGQFGGVSCASPAVCIAVGSSVERSGNGTALAERWNGTRWAIQSLPRPADAVATSLSAVSCTSAAACTAVGYYSTGGAADFTLAERWNGTTWSIQPTPNPVAGSYLSGVSCTSATACTAVGAYRNVPSLVTLAERWNGTAWAIQPTPNATSYDALFAVSCPSASACTAVGYSAASSKTHAVAERWNGTAWAIQPTPSPAGNDALSGVSCTSATACTAVGYSIGTSKTTLAERWNGTAWAIQPTPSPAGNDALSGVSCTSATACTAVGSDTGSQGYPEATLAEAWNGTTWAVQPTSGPDQGQLMWLAGVSCTSATACTAAGYNGAAAGVTLAEAWNGTAWATQPTPSPTGAQASALTGISCISATACTAVGNATNNAAIFGDVTLAERWNGIRWAVMPTPKVPGAITGYLAQSTLSTVSCTSVSACTAVGYYRAPNSSSGYFAGLAERWNGTKWAVQPLPTSAEFSPLTGVSCMSATSCTAVGIYFTTTVPYRVLAERWNGTRWAVEPAPNPAGSVTMGGVSCTSATACILVGSYESGDNQFTLAERWNGTSWAIQPTPNPAGSLQSYLTGVSCASATSCTAVGYASGTTPGIVDVTLAEHWDGTKWAIQPTPNQNGPVNQLRGVSCTSATSCTAVGDGNISKVLAEAWNGTTWAIQSTATPAGARYPLFPAVSCRPAGPCTGVGGYGHTLVERRF